MKYKQALLISFILIVALSIAIHFFFVEGNSHFKYDGYGLPFLCMFIIVLLGYTAWRKYPIKWPSLLFLLVYIAIIFILGSFFLINKFVFQLPAGGLAIVRNTRDVFNSPMPFIGLYVLVKYIEKATPAQTGQQS